MEKTIDNTTWRQLFLFLSVLPPSQDITHARTYKNNNNLINNNHSRVAFEINTDLAIRLSTFLISPELLILDIAFCNKDDKRLSHWGEAVGRI